MKDGQKNRTRQQASQLFFLYVPVSPPNMATPKDEGKNKLRGHFPIRPSFNGLAQLFFVVPFLKLWWAAGGSSRAQLSLGVTCEDMYREVNIPRLPDSHLASEEMKIR